MTTKQLRNKVIGKINQTDDDELLNEVYRLLEDHFEDTEICLLSENHKKAIEEEKAK